MTAESKRGQEVWFGLLLLAVCLIPLLCYVVWSSRHTTAATDAGLPLIARFDERTSVELVAVSHTAANPNVFWGPTGSVLQDYTHRFAATGLGQEACSILFRGLQPDSEDRLSMKLRSKKNQWPHGSVGQRLPSGEYQLQFEISVTPETGLFASNDIELWYASMGERTVSTLTPGEPKIALTVDGQSLAASVTAKDGGLEVRVTSGGHPNTDWQIWFYDPTEKHISPALASYFANGNQLTHRFMASAFSRIAITRKVWDRKVIFRDISFRPGVHAKPTVSEVMPVTSEE